MVTTAKTFDVFSREFKREPGPTCAAMLAAGSVVRVRLPIFGATAFVTQHESVERLLKASTDFSTDFLRSGRSGLATFLRWMPGPLRLLSENMLQKDGVDHRRLRRLVDGAFRRNEIEALRPRIESIADELIGRLARSSDGDLVRHVARELPLAVICEMLGLPQEHRPQFTRWMASLSEVHSIGGVARLIPAINRINRYLRARIEIRRADPQDDLISALVHAEGDGDRLSNNELLAMCFLLFVAGHETTTHLISVGTLTLLQNPGELERLRAEPDSASTAADELLRHVSPVQMTKPRMPVGEMQFEGVTLRKGENVIAFLSSANRDPAVFDVPDRLDVKRRENRHVAFGSGPHFCLGAWLGRAEMELFLKRLIDRAPNLQLSVPEDSLQWRRGTGLRAVNALPVRLR
ncbi:MAG: cytochrome P450 family protein [Hyphomicrobiaceae bacterium]